MKTQAGSTEVDALESGTTKLYRVDNAESLANCNEEDIKLAAKTMGHGFTLRLNEG